MTSREFSSRNDAANTFQMRQIGIEKLYVVGDHLQDFVKMIETHFYGDAYTSNRLDCSRPPRVSTLSRRGTRRILNGETLARKLSKETDYQNVTVYELEDPFTFQQEVEVMLNTDILIGAGLTSLIILGNKTCSKVIKLFPSGDFVPA